MRQRRRLEIWPELGHGLDNLRAHKLRSLLTMLGMIFGVAAVIAMLSIGAGAQQKMIAFIEQLGVRNIIVEAREAPEYQTLQRVRKLSAGLSFQDLRAIQANIGGARRRRARASDSCRRRCGRSRRATCRRCTACRAPTRRSRVWSRRAADSSPNGKTRRPQRSPCSGRRAAASLFGIDDPIGQFVKVNQQWFRVIGVAGPQLVAESDIGGLPVQDRNNVVFVPLMAAILRLEDSQSYLKDEIDGIYLNLSPDGQRDGDRRDRPRACSTPRIGARATSASSCRPNCLPNRSGPSGCSSS